MEEPVPVLEALIDRLDSRRGCLFESSYEFPGRYCRWTMGFADPPLCLEAWGRRFRVAALNARGRALLAPVAACLRACPSLAALESFLGGTAAEPVSRTLDGLDPGVALERASLTGMARQGGRLPDWDTVDGEEFSVLMEVGRTFRSSRGELVGPDVAQGKVACDTVATAA